MTNIDRCVTLAGWTLGLHTITLRLIGATSSEEAWQLFEEAFRLHLIACHKVGEAKNARGCELGTQSYRLPPKIPPAPSLDRVGQHFHQLLMRLVSLARGELSIQRAWRRTQNSLALCQLELHLKADTVYAMLNNPTWGIRELRDAIARREERKKRQHLQTWKNSLVHQGLPRRSAYRWIRGEEPRAHPVIQEKGTVYSGPKAFFEKVEQFWEPLMNARDDEDERFLNWYKGTSASTMEHCPKTLKVAIQTLSSQACSGPDSWPVSAAKLSDEDILQTLLLIYKMIEHLSRWPTKLVQGRVQLIPKPGMAPTPEGLRPITIVSIWIRIWSRYRLLLLDPKLLASLHPSLRGGIPGRDATPQLGHLLAMIETDMESERH